jgi:hypothetical protein
MHSERRASEQREHPLARIGAQVGPGVAVGAVLLVLQSVVHQRDVWVGAGVLAVAAIVVWLGISTRAAAAARERIATLEQQAAAQRAELNAHANAQSEELDRLQNLMARLARATYPDWLLVAIHHTEHTGGRIDIDPKGLRFVSASKDGTWTIALPLSADPEAQARDHEGLHHALGIGQREYTTALIESTR